MASLHRCETELQEGFVAVGESSKPGVWESDHLQATVRFGFWILDQEFF